MGGRFKRERENGGWVKEDGGRVKRESRFRGHYR